VYYYLIGSLKRRLILELQDSFARHPLYAKYVPNIQNRFAFKSRPQFGIVVKGSSANKVQLSADNYVGEVLSHTMLAYVGDHKFPLEWVREDLNRVRANDGVFPSTPGIYYLEVLQAPTNPSEPGYFAIDPLYTEPDEAVLVFQTGTEKEAQLQNLPVTGTLRLWENNRRILIEGTDYEINYQTGAIDILQAFPPNTTWTGEYRYAGTPMGPVPFYWNRADFETLPGAVLAFGKRAAPGDTVAVVVYQDRVTAAQAYGGRIDASFDLEIIARDTIQMEEVADLVLMYLWAEKRSSLADEGIEIVDVSMGGEAEEVADETGDNYFYQASMSVQVQSDWEIHLPMPLTISRATPTTKAGDSDPAAPSGLTLKDGELFMQTHPILANRNPDYERIG